MKGAAISMKSDKEWEAEHDLNTLVDAEKIKKDPARLKAVMVRKKMLMTALGNMDYKTSHKKKSGTSHAY